MDSIGKTGSPGDVSIMGPTPVLQKKKGREKDEWPRYQVTLAPASRTSHVREQFPWLLPHAGLTICQFTRKTRKVSAARVRPSRRHVAAYREAFSRASPPPSPSSPPSRFVSAAIRAYRRVTHEWPLCAPMNRWSYKNLICPPLTSFFVHDGSWKRL